MKKKLLAAALSLNLVACTEGQSKTPEPKQESSMVGSTDTKIVNASTEELELEVFRKKIFDRIEKYYDFEGAAYLNLNEEERQQFYNDYIDMSEANSIQKLKRFDRGEVQPKVSLQEQKKRELKIQAILDQCNKLIGPEPKDKYLRALALTQGPYKSAQMRRTPNDKEFYTAMQQNYLSERTYKCESYLYTNEYDLSDFDYPEETKKSNAEQIKRQKIEKLYELAYLNIKKAGLLRKIDSAYYPKSLIRAHADQTGLTNFIQEQEQIGDHKHDQLAIKYFGSYDKWTKSLNQFLDQQMINRKIETQVTSQTDNAV